jgi:tryptophan-rich sensory protein
MGVKTGNQLQSLNTAVVTTQQLDIKAVLVYKLGTILQIGVMILVLLGMEKLLMFIDNNSSVPSWFRTLVTGLFFALLSIHSRIFSLLEKTRSRLTYDQVIRPRLSPPPLGFPIVWMIIAVLREFLRN